MDGLATTTRLFDFDALRAAPPRTDPYPHIVASGCVTDAAAAAIRADYPPIAQSGYLPASKLERRGAYDAILRDLESAELADILSEKLGLDLADKPRMITVRRLSQLSDGPIHNDSQSKICTALLYLNAEWDRTSAGCIRVLRSDRDMDDYVTEVPPLAGHFFAFKRTQNSWHGHPPFAGERFVIQTTFLTSAEALARKENRGRLQLWLKRLNPFQK
jgi:SM-20-related protein